MASLVPTLTRKSSLSLLPGIARLALWRFKHMWRLLLVTWLGLLAMIMLVCAGPLFTQVANSAYLRSEIAGAPDGPNLTVEALSTHPTQEQLRQIASITSGALHGTLLSTYQHGDPQLVIQTPVLDMVSGGVTTPSAFLIDGYDNNTMARHATPVQGRLPRVTNDNTLEVVLAQDAASALGLHVGSTLQGNFPIALGSQTWSLRVVGIIAPETNNDPYWALGNPFDKSTIDLTSSYYTVIKNAPSYNLIAATDALEPRIATLQSTPSQNLLNDFALFWRYPFNLSQLDASKLDTLSQEINRLDALLSNRLLSAVPDVQYAGPFGTLFGALRGVDRKAIDDSIGPTYILLVTLGLVLFLVSMLANVLVERQAAIIATLRSRGATRRHIFGTLATQGLVLALAALLPGPFLAILLVSALSRLLLTSDSIQSLAVITDHPLQAVLGVKWYAIIAVVVALLVMLFAINRAVNMNVVSWRRQTARAGYSPFWRRLNLDVFFALLLCVGYVAFLYLWPALTSTASQINPVVYVLLTNLGFLGAPLLVIAALLLFLRYFPAITRLATRLATQRRDAPAVLALAQMEREPQRASRMVVLLALAIATSCFLGTLIASKEQRNVDTATFYVGGADFSGQLPATEMHSTLSALKAHYASIPGVVSATPGYQDLIQVDYAGEMQSPAHSHGPTTIDAVDAESYARTERWSSTYSTQPLNSVMAQLIAHRSDGIAHHVVYALVDLATWQELHLAPGMQFNLPMNSTGTVRANFIALAQINYLPGVYDTSADVSSGTGLIVDYQNYASVKADALHASTIAPNYIWLRTSDDAASLNHLRTVLPGLSDRRTILANMQNDPDHLGVIGVLALGIATALVLALLGMLISSWLNAARRLTTFAVMRALGMPPRQIAAVLLWEQGLIYLLAFALGIALGALLTIFVGATVSELTIMHGHPWDSPLNVPPIHVVVPYLPLLLLLGAFALICVAALALMARVASRPSLSQTLRLNED